MQDDNIIICIGRLRETGALHVPVKLMSMIHLYIDAACLLVLYYKHNGGGWEITTEDKEKPYRL